MEEVLTCLLTDHYVEESRRIGRGQCTLESGLVCHCIEVLPISECHCAMLGLADMHGGHGGHVIALYSLWH